MCGIAGILRLYAPGVAPPPILESVPESWLDALDAAIKHRGPDGQGRFRDRVVRSDGVTADVALVHRRLSILDHDGGAQPMPLRRVGSMGESGVADRVEPRGTPDAPRLFRGGGGAGVEYSPVPPGEDACVVAFNGCIYNHRDLRRELVALGCRFHTDHSDTEVLLHGWSTWGEALFDRLDGMYAFLLWDRASGTLIRARDSFGEKPLFAHHVPVAHGWINLFASVPPGTPGLLRDLGTADFGVPPAGTAAAWLRFGFGPSLPVPGARAVEPGSFEVSGPAPRPVPHRATAAELQTLIPPRVSLHGVLTLGGERSVPVREARLGVADLDRLIGEAVASRLDADVPLGVFLSGGVDSSLIAWHAKRAAGKVRTFTVRMPDPSYDESGHAEAAAAAIGAEHTTLDCGAKPAEDLVRLIETIGQPFGDSSLLPAYWVSRAARQHVAVALSGDGGDELFLGYDRYFAPHWLELPKGMFGGLARWLTKRAMPKSRLARAGRLLDAASNLGYWDLVSIFPDSMLRELVPESGAIIAERDTIRRHIPRSLTTAQGGDLVNYLPDDLLRKTDAASMMVALEVRCPFLDPRVVRAALSARLEDVIPGGRRKGLLRGVARLHLPPSIIDRPKMGFAIPVGDWFRSDYGGIRTLLLDHLHAADAFPADLLGFEINRVFIGRMVAEHMSRERDHAQRLYMLLVLSLWSRWMKRVP